MPILIYGANGMLGHKLVQILGARFDVWGTIRGEFAEIERFGIFDRRRTIEQIDVTDIASVRGALEIAKPDVVINAAGVIKQLPESVDSVRTLKINSVFPQRLAELSVEYGFRLITLSTDCVFSGTKGNYSEADVPDAETLYGISKLLGEVTNHNCLTIRTSIIGRELTTAHSLVEWFLNNRGGAVKGYANAIYSGFPTIVLAEILPGIIAEHPELRGVYHISSDPINKFDLLKLLNKYYQANINIEPCEDHVIDRSLDSSVFARATGFRPANWEEMIQQMVDDPTPYETWRN
jgi:dTDP-4-dehydrorhamnose reductase